MIIVASTCSGECGVRIGSVLENYGLDVPTTRSGITLHENDANKSSRCVCSGPRSGMMVPGLNVELNQLSISGFGAILRCMPRTLAGIHAVRHALDSGQSIRELVIEKGKQHPRLNELVHLARKAGIPIRFLPRQSLERLADGVPHQGVVARLAGEASQVDFKAWLDELDMEAEPLVLLLDQVTDPHNLGACIRTAGAAGCAAVIMPRDHAADLDSPVVAKSACGALSRLPVIPVTNLVRAIESLQEKGFWVCGLAGEASSDIYAAKLTGSLGLVMGAEGAGIRRLVRERCDQLLRIPMPGALESLNVSVATGVALFEAMRQRRA